MFKISYIYDLVDNISPQLKKIQTNLETVRKTASSSMQSVSKSFETAKQSINNVTQSFKNIGSTLAPTSIAMGLIGTKAFKSASEFEMLRIRMDVLTGSAEQGAIAFQEVAKYAAFTPFEITDISKSLNMLMSTGGMKFDEAMKSIKILGDIASISGGEMSGMALAFSQTAATSRLLGQDFNQFVNNSVPLMKILTDYTGKSSAEIMALKEAGKLSFDVVAKAMEKATQKGGLFENGAVKMSKTLSGLYSTLKDNVNIAFSELGTEMAKSINLAELIGKLTVYIDKLTNTFKGLNPDTKKFITYAILITTALAPLFLILGSLLAVLGLVSGGLSIVARMIAFIINPIKLLGASLFLLAHTFVFLVSPLGLFIVSLVSLGVIVYKLKDSFVIVYNFLKDYFVGVFDTIANKIKSVMNLINDFRNDASIVFKFIGLDKLSESIAPNMNNPQAINKPQQFTAGGQLDVNIKGLPKGSNAGFTPRPNNFLPVGVNSVFAGI